MRFAEFGLLLLPLAIFIAWRIMAPSGPPPKILVWSVVAAVAATGLFLIVLRYEDAAPPNAGYVPARQDGAHILPPKVERTPPAAVR